MGRDLKKTIFHIDVNSAYLSWDANWRLQHGEKIDLREIPSVVGGDEESRHGIVLAKSTPAKAFRIQTGETLYSARSKCPNLKIVPPHYNLYIKSSNALYQLLQEYTPIIERFSIDENFLDLTGTDYLYDDYIKLAYKIKNRIKIELGFTVNIGISTNKLLAKVAGDLEKPDKVHTLFPEEIKDKMWKLPVEDLFMVGRATLPKLHKLNIFTIGDLANYDLELLKTHLKSHGQLIWEYANGIDNSEIRRSSHIDMKGIGNSTTIAFDVTEKDTAHMILLSLCENVASRLRSSNNCCTVVSVSIRENNFVSYSQQLKLYTATDSTRKISEVSYKLFDQCWRGNPIRHLGVHLSGLCSNNFCQYSLFEKSNLEKQRAIDCTIDKLREKYGSDTIKRLCFIGSNIHHMSGGIVEGEYPIMSSLL